MKKVVTKSVVWFFGALGILSASNQLIKSVEAAKAPDTSGPARTIARTTNQDQLSVTDQAVLDEFVDRLREKYGDEIVNNLVIKVENGQYVVSAYTTKKGVIMLCGPTSRR